jgi:DNA-directed RNA polymerase subunit K/omega
VELDSLAAHRARYLSAWANDPSILSTYQTQAADYRAQRTSSASALRTDPTNASASGTLSNVVTFFQTQAVNYGVRNWWEVANVGLTAARDGAQTLVDQANNDARPVIRAMRDMHANITSQLVELNTRQADLYGVLFDLYDNYLRTYGATDSTGQRYAARKAVLAEMLQAPRVTNPTVTVTDFGYLSSVSTLWTGTHPRGIYEYLIQDAGDSLFTVGAQGTTKRWLYTVNPAGGREARNQVVMVRGGAGLTGSTGTPYAVTFRQGSSSNPVTQVAVPPADLTAPSVPVISYTGLRSFPGANGDPEFWTADATRIAVQWSATDAESGIAEYEYRVVTFALPTAPSTALVGMTSGMTITPIVPTPLTQWASAGGRTTMTIQGLSLPANRLISVEVRAKNGAGLTGSEGGSPGLRYDPTPPTFPAGTTLAYGGRSFAAPLYGFIMPGMLPPLQPACGVVATFGATAPQPVWNGRLVTVTPDNGVVGGGAAASLLLGLPTATDGETGVAAYHYRVDAAAPSGPVPTDGWTALPVGGTSFVATGPQFLYGQPRWISLIAENGAGGRSAPIVYGPVTVADPTTPSAPGFCADVSSAGFIAYMAAPSTDAETGVRGYQMRVRGPTGAIVRDFPAGATVDWPASQANVNQAFRLANSTTIGGMIGGVTVGGRHTVELRAVSGLGAFGEVARSGEVLVDFSPPPVAGVTVSLRAFVATITLTIADDPESGIAGVDVAFGTTPSDPTLTGSGASLVLPYTSVAAGVGTTSYQQSMPVNSPLYVYVRVRNGKGLVSTPTVARIR